jgi:ribosomal protein uS17
MARQNPEDLRRLDEQKLDHEINEAYRAMFTLRFQHASRQLENYRELRTARRRIARLLTIKRETVVISVERKKKHRLYHKVVTVTERYKAHDQDDSCKLGDVVRIEEARPMSKDKRWRVIEILTRGDVADVAPETIGREIEETQQLAPKSEVQA